MFQSWVAYNLDMHVLMVAHCVHAYGLVILTGSWLKKLGSCNGPLLGNILISIGDVHDSSKQSLIPTELWRRKKLS